MKIIIFDNPERQDRNFREALRQNTIVKISDNQDELDFDVCKIVFLHTGDLAIFNLITINNKVRIILIEFSGGGLENAIYDNADGWKFKAKIESPEQVNNVLTIIDKEEFTKEDVEMILNFDPKLEELLTPFQSVLPLVSEWKKHKSDTKEDLWQKRTDLRNHLNK